MTQEKIIEILGNKKLTRAEIQELTELAQVIVSRCLRQLVKYHEIEKEYSEEIKKYVYKKKDKKKKRMKVFKPSSKNN